MYDQANNRCVFVNWGSNAPIKAIDLTTNTVTTVLTTSYSNCDGVSRDAAGNYYISNWGNQSVIKYNSGFTSSATVVASSLSSPADIFVNTVDNVLAIPNSGNNTVTFVTLPDLGNADLGNTVFDKVSISPNPISKLSKLKFDLPTTMHVSGTIYDVNGKVISQLNFINENMQNGEVTLAVSELNMGVYYLVFKADDKSKTVPLVVE
ncbi:MAG: T9SS type A sorting domain-containing protein [Flavobacterium sp. JAD_PAG50586_2]|nr:MAG: T9SS type A sorting domain-containing protein [Flavobacterium sp. JAD_PAG50586_2]